MPHSSRHLRVLVVDDERVIADTIAMILNSQGYEAFTAYSAEEALAWSNREHPNVVITEIMMMSDMSGIELAIHLAENLPECKVVLMSGSLLRAPVDSGCDGTGLQLSPPRQARLPAGDP